MTASDPPRPDAACPCGSGRKFKNCHGLPAAGSQTATEARTLFAALVATGTLALVGWGLYLVERGRGGAAPAPGWERGTGVSPVQTAPGADPALRRGRDARATSYADVPGLGLERLGRVTRSVVLAGLNLTPCPDGSGRTLAACLNADPNCPEGRPAAQAVIEKWQAKILTQEVREIPGLDLAGLSDEQRRRVVDHLNEHDCVGGSGFTVATCIAYNREYAAACLAFAREEVARARATPSGTGPP